MGDHGNCERFEKGRFATHQDSSGARQVRRTGAGSGSEDSEDSGERQVIRKSRYLRLWLSEAIWSRRYVLESRTLSLIMRLRGVISPGRKFRKKSIVRQDDPKYVTGAVFKYSQRPTTTAALPWIFAVRLLRASNRSRSGGHETRAAVWYRLRWRSGLHKCHSPHTRTELFLFPGRVLVSSIVQGGKPDLVPLTPSKSCLTARMPSTRPANRTQAPYLPLGPAPDQS